MDPIDFQNWLHKHNITMATAASELMVNKASVSRWYNGIAPIPGMVTLAIETLERRWRLLGGPVQREQPRD